MENHPEIARFALVAEWLVKRGWTEANAGNLSMRLDRDDPSLSWESQKQYKLAHTFPSLDGSIFLVTATKSRARDIPVAPEKNVGLFEITDQGSSAACLWGSGPPTSEFPAHLAVHEMCLAQRPEMKAVLHTHPPNLVAMSHMPDLQLPGSLNKALRKMHPEVGILVPGGVAAMPYSIPGSVELGLATCAALRDCNVAVWPMHGVVSLAPDLEKALDQVEIVEKAAMIYLLVLSTGQKPVGLSDEQIMRSREFWGIKDEAK